MKIIRIEVKNFRKLSHAIIENLDKGLNVIVGDNEAGKSTLVAALRAVIFEKHTLSGSPIRDMLPYKQAVRPEVWLDFEHDGETYKLYKAFGNKPSAILTSTNMRWEGDAVEDELANLFGFSRPSKGASKPEEHHGIFGLLWVEQGKSHEGVKLGGSRDKISSALEMEVGQITGGERGRILLARAQERFETFFSLKTRKPRGDYSTLPGQIEQLKSNHSDLQRQVADFENKVAALQTIKTRLENYDKNQDLNLAERMLDAAQKKSQELKSLETAWNTAQTNLAEARFRMTIAQDALKPRLEMIAKIEKSATDLAQAKSQLEQALEYKSTLAQSDDSAIANRDALKAQLSQCDAQIATIKSMQMTLSQQQQFASLSSTFAKAQKSQENLLNAKQERAKILVTDADMKRLSARNDALTALNIQAQVNSVKLNFAPNGSNAVFHDGVKIETEFHVKTQTSFTLEGFGAITITPNGDSLQLAQQITQEQNQLASELERLNVSSVSQAMEQLQSAKNLDGAIAGFTNELTFYAPNGLLTLEQQVATLRASVTTEVSVSAEDLAENLRTAISTQTALNTEISLLEARLAREKAQLDAASLKHASLAGTFNTMSATHDALIENLQASRAIVSDEDLKIKLQSAQNAYADIEHQSLLAQSTLNAANPDEIRLTLESAQGMLTNITKDIDKLKLEKVSLESELTGAGHYSVEEECEAVKGELEILERRYAKMHLEAQASRLLFDTLERAQRETKERWLTPVREKAAPYLRLLQTANDSDIALDHDSLELDSLTRNGISEPFSSLSFGAREQIAVVTRLALADILRQSGQSTSVVLDDALVNTDDQRLARMHLVLRKAADHQQIIILTCRERDFQSLGAPIQRIQHPITPEH